MKNHTSAEELWVGFYKKDSGKKSITWPESVDEALCFGWIDGIRKRVDDEAYEIRFTPRRTTSTWSAINIKRVAELRKRGLIQPAGLRAFEARKESRSRIYAYEQRPEKLVPRYEEKLRKNKVAWKFFSAQPPWYRKLAVWYVSSAKQEATRLRRLEKVIEFSAGGKRI